MKRKVIIMGAAGRDFHNYNTFFRDNPDYNVIGFTAAQIPGIENRDYPKKIAHTKKDISIHKESELLKLIEYTRPHEVVLAYSDLSHQEVMNKASMVLAAGCDFRLMGGESTMLQSTRPVIAVTAVRTGCGKSSTSKAIVDMIKNKGLTAVVVRHPMPYGNLIEQQVQRFAKSEDLEKCTIEEREEYEQYVDNGIVVYAGVDYQLVLENAEKEADIIIWDGGNNDIPFFKPNYHICVVDPLRAGNELTYYPGQVNLRMADMVIINKVNSAKKMDVELVERNIRKVNTGTVIIKADSDIGFIVPESQSLKDICFFNKKVVIIEDGPTITHGNMSYGAGFGIADGLIGCEIIDPKPYAVGSIKETYEKYPHIGRVLPAMGYNKEQIKDLIETINAVPADVVISATPIDLEKLVKINKPILRVGYELEPEDKFYEILDNFIDYIVSQYGKA